MSKILIAMFSPTISDKINFGLTNRGHNCSEVSNPQSLKETVTSDVFDLVIISVNDNETLLKSFITAFKNTDEYKAIPVLAVIGKSSVGVIDSMFNAGADECISRPFKLAHLISKVEKLLKEGVAQTNNEENPIPEVLLDKVESLRTDGRLLGDVSEVFTGASVSDPKARRLSSPGLEWSPVVVNEAVKPFYINKEREFFLMRKNLMRRIPQKSEYDVAEKVLLKRTLSPLTAAVDTSRSVFSSELYGIQTAKGFSCSSLACILNSRFAHFYFNRCRSASDDLRSIYLSKSDIQQLPIAIPDPKDQKRLEKIYNDINQINIKYSEKNQITQRTKSLSEMNSLIFNVYGINDKCIKALNSLHF